ncbi:HNH endonuclease [Paraburkholderia sp. C35]|uniref:HNH endonuclease n=1 Tax=Paraburkholderia sp. C35 TaxID=2126993 RepID=UPI001951EBB0|nr:HNH endonuclease [Paraburkholderia sp. C35]
MSENSKIECAAPGDPCIEWGGYRKRDGYGVVGFEGKNRTAHRLAYCQHNGISIESIVGLEVRHTCDNRSCINPRHLILGTHTENMKDMVERHRNPTGEKHGSSILTRNQVEEIRRLYVANSETASCASLARRYGVHKSTIYRIVTGDGWK